MINQSDLSINADEYVPIAQDADVLSSGFPGPEPEPYRVDEIVHQYEQQLISTDEPHVEPNDLLNDVIPNDQKPVAEIVIAQPEPAQEFTPTPETVAVAETAAAASEPEPLVEENLVKEVAVAAAAVAATTAIVAATAVSATKTAASPKAKPTDAKKPETKGKVPPIRRPTATATATSAASKVAAKPSTTLASKTAAAPRVASRTVAPKVASTTEKKTTTTTTATRKPISNGSKYLLEIHALMWFFFIAKLLVCWQIRFRCDKNSFQNDNFDFSFEFQLKLALHQLSRKRQPPQAVQSQNHLSELRAHRLQHRNQLLLVRLAQLQLVNSQLTNFDHFIFHNKNQQIIHHFQLRRQLFPNHQLLLREFH